MLFIDLWKKVVIWVVVALGLVLALPNAFTIVWSSLMTLKRRLRLGLIPLKIVKKQGFGRHFCPLVW